MENARTAFVNATQDLFWRTALVRTHAIRSPAAEREPALKAFANVSLVTLEEIAVKWTLALKRTAKTEEFAKQEPAFARWATLDRNVARRIPAMV